MMLVRRWPAEPIIARRNLLRSRGLTDTLIAELAGGVHQTTITCLGKRAGHVADFTARGVLSIPVPHAFEPADFARLPRTGSVRRLQALNAVGYSLEWQARLMGCHRNVLDRLMTDGAYNGKANDSVTGLVFKRVRDFYDEYEFITPTDVGMTSTAAVKAANSARRKGFAPPGCWDPDTIDDPKAAPEWTGACGLIEGFRIHLREGIPSCPRCWSAAWRKRGRAAHKKRKGPAGDG